MTSPFDEARYRALLEGLEAVEMPLSVLERTKRVDSEFFLKKHLNVAKRLGIIPDASSPSCRQGMPASTAMDGAMQRVTSLSLDSGNPCRNDAVASMPLDELAAISDGNHFAISDEFGDEGIPYYRGQDVVGHFFIEQAAPVFITEKAYSQPYMRRSHLKRGDVLLSIIGTIGESSLVTTDTPATCSCKLAILRPHDIAPEYLSVFLRCEYGRSQIERYTRGAVQMGLLLEDMDQIHVSRFTPDFEKRIARIVSEAQESLDTAITITERAEQTLLRALGLENWQPPEPLSYTRSSRGAFATGRLDAEFFQPRYEALRIELEARFELRSLHELGDVSKGVTVPYHEDGTVPIIRSGDLSDIDDESRFLKTLSNEAIFHLQRHDVLISSIGFGSIGKIQVFDTPGRFGTVSEVTVIRQNVVNAFYLAAFLRSVAGQKQIERFITGATGQLHLYPKDVARFWVPIISSEEQDQFESLAVEARQQKVRAKNLLEAAKRAVEIAIEDSEGAALARLGEITGQFDSLAASSTACNDERQPEKPHDPATDSTSGTKPEAVARQPQGPGEPAGGLSPAGAGLHPELHGAGKRAGGPGAATPTAESTRPLDATRELATAEGARTYTEVAESLAVNIVRCLEALFDGPPEDIAITPKWICGIHRRIAGEMFPDWAGRFRSTDVQVGGHLPPPAYEVAVQVRNFCLDLDERLRHLDGAESIAGLLAWVDWRFQWIHPFKDFNGWVGRILLVALAYKLGLPPLDPAQVDKAAYFAALRSADAGNIDALLALWLGKLTRR